MDAFPTTPFTVLKLCRFSRLNASPMTCRFTVFDSGTVRASRMSTLKKSGPFPALRPRPPRAVGVGMAIAKRIEAGDQVEWRKRVRRHDSRQCEIRQQVVSEAAPPGGLPRGLGHDIGDFENAARGDRRRGRVRSGRPTGCAARTTNCSRWPRPWPCSRCDAQRSKTRPRTASPTARPARCADNFGR